MDSPSHLWNVKESLSVSLILIRNPPLESEIYPYLFMDFIEGEGAMKYALTSAKN